MNWVATIFAICFAFVLVTFWFGAIGERDKEVRIHYIMATCVVAALEVIILFLGGR